MAEQITIMLNSDIAKKSLVVRYELGVTNRAYKIVSNHLKKNKKKVKRQQ